MWKRSSHGGPSPDRLFALMRHVMANATRSRTSQQQWNSGLTPPAKGEAHALARETGCVGWLVCRSAAAPIAAACARPSWLSWRPPPFDLSPECIVENVRVPHESRLIL